jgi:hypothetical protein
MTRLGPRTTFYLLALVPLFIVFCAAPALIAQSTGQWSAVQTLPYIPIHISVLPSGKVFFFSYYADSLHPQIWDPATNSVTATTNAPYALFCSGHALLADGRVFIAGGHIADYTGYKHAVIYDAGANTFTTVPDMNSGRWYPTNTVLPNGDVLVVTGDQTSNTTPNPLPQVYQLSTNTWRDLTTAQLSQALYPVMLVAPNGKVFNAGPSHTTRYLDTSGTGAWTTVGTTKFAGSRTYGPGIMYENGKVIEIGGSDPPTATAEIIDLNSATPTWTLTDSMHFARRQHNAVALPDGKIFVVGGSSGSGFDNSAAPVAQTEMWDPATGHWTLMASIAKYRGYHSTAFLLPDGRVFSGGGNVGGPNFQLFSPPYLFAGARPTISSAPTQVGYGQTQLISTPDAAAIKKVSLIRLPSVTHTNDMNGRFMTLAFTATPGGLNVTFPANANLAPPGHYMLFILNGTGVPSVASILHISSGGNTSTGSITGNVTNASGAPLGGVAVSAGTASATTLVDGSYTLSNIPGGSVTVTASLANYQNASEDVSVAAGSTATAATLQLAAINPGNIAGTVQNSGGSPISGASVIAAGVSATTNASGNYALNDLPAGSTTMTASASGFNPASTTVTVVAATTTSAPTITLAPNSGAVTGTVKKSSGAAIVGATVSYGGGTTTTNSTGVYSLTNVPVGTIQLAVSASGFISQTRNVSITGGVTATSNFTLVASTGTGKVTGKITNASTGAAVSAVTVKWSGGSTTTSTTGIYTLSNVTTGTRAITATKSGYLSRTLNASVTTGGSTTLNIPIATGGKASVKVTKGGVALSGATVTLKGGVIATTVSGTTSTTGVYTTNWIPIGTYSITVSKTGLTAKTKSATLTSGATTTVTFVF